MNGVKMQTCDVTKCNMYQTHKILKHKWLPPLIKILHKNKESTFSELLVIIEYISNPQLSNMLKLALEKNLITKQSLKYQLTDKGLQLYKIIDLMDQFEV